MDTWGKSVVTDGKFCGCIDLEGTGEGHKALIMVQLGDGGGLKDAIAEFKKTLEDTQKKSVVAVEAATAAVREAAVAGLEVNAKAVKG